MQQIICTTITFLKWKSESEKDKSFSRIKDTTFDFCSLARVQL